MSTQKATYIMTLQEGQVLSFLIDAEGKTLEIHADDLHSTKSLFSIRSYHFFREKTIRRF